MLITKKHFDKIYAENKIICTCIVLMITNECNANCKVCLGKQVFKSKICKKLCECYSAECKRCIDRTATDAEFYERVEAILATLNSPIVNIIITGGEPTISQRLLPILEIIDKYDYISKSITLETNGASLMDAEIAQALIKRNVHIQLSRYNVLDGENNAEFQFSSFAQRDADIRKLSRIYGELISTSTVLLKKHIADVHALVAFVDHYREYGIRQHSFLQVMADIGLRGANKQLLDYYDEQIVEIEGLSQQLTALGYEKVSDSGDEAFRMIIHRYKDSHIIFTRSNLALQHEKPTCQDISRFLIMPSGDIGVNGIEVR